MKKTSDIKRSIPLFAY